MLFEKYRCVEYSYSTILKYYYLFHSPLVFFFISFFSFSFFTSCSSSPSRCVILISLSLICYSHNSKSKIPLYFAKLLSKKNKRTHKLVVWYILYYESCIRNIHSIILHQSNYILLSNNILYSTIFYRDY